MNDQAPIIVIGSGLAGYNLVKEFRKIDQETPILMLSQDDGHSYSKPMLSTGLTKGKSADELSMGDPGKMAKQLNVSIRNHTHVELIETDKKQVVIGEEALPYSKLILATGAIVNKLSFPGSELSKVVSINDLMDYREFRGLLEGKKHVLIMGAGLIGCEYANDLLNSDYEVTVVNPSETALSNLIPQAAGKALQQGLELAGAKFKMGTYVTEINEEQEGLKAKLSNGEVLACDLVVSAVGLKANTHLAQQSGIQCAQGIQTNSLLQTSISDIYALGDCAEIDGHVRLYVLPLMSSARALAKTLTGTETPVQFSAMPIATKTPACPVVVCPPGTTTGEWQFDAADDNETLDTCGRYVDSEGTVHGFVLTGKRSSEKQAMVKELGTN